MLSKIQSLSLLALGAAAECDIMCIAIYSVNVEKCTCEPIYGMECHPQYGLGCSQYEYDLKEGRDPSKNPNQSEPWFYGKGEEGCYECPEGYQNIYTQNQCVCEPESYSGDKKSIFDGFTDIHGGASTMAASVAAISVLAAATLF
mmetsp:Transcript_16749/g.21179  ORF Transcript_16749/g.21179 Transcript_16749/m.21179 type:complete len:145 (-) Transcript_16749:61-495(-)|eukprot:CAMPEP_0170462294 /NCGR_PEP_ID=MMETSP0123-20130129/7857_1 /TAXON_ID=182087 /ORGANISM="Favella ehrenbergii, Strain Fehren 1" /LENGTH=144 /DNA_ID=CAMNT_0010727485 /DNA_START=20 /DNA_END=454 /DNA_ORIENTATION=+